MGRKPVLLLLVLLTACSSIHTDTMDVRVLVSPPEAELLVDGVVRGTGPMTIPLTKWDSHTVLARIGDRTTEAKVRSEMTGDGEVCLVLGFFLILPWFALTSSDFWQLNPQDVVLVVPATPPAPTAVVAP